MNTRWMVLALALCAAPLASARAQEAPASESDELTPPELPEVPEGLRAAVNALRQTVDDTAECFTGGGRLEHEADPRCPQWYARLARSGAAGAFAIAEQLRPGRGRDAQDAAEPLRNSEGEYERGPRLVQLMARTQRPEVVPFLISYVVRTATQSNDPPSDSNEAMLRALRTLTGDDPAPTAPWEDDRAYLDSPLTRTELARRWVRWFRDHQGMTVAQWRAAGISRAQQRLTSDDIIERYSAIARLAPLPAHRVAVTASLHELLTRDDLPAAARVQLRRLARQRRIPLPANNLQASAR